MHSKLFCLIGAVFAAAFVFAAEAATCVVSPSGQSGYWNGESLAEAATGQAGTWRASGSIAAGFAGNGFAFGGGHDALMLPSGFALSSQNFSVECWIKRASTSVASNDPEAGEFFANSNQGLAFGLVHDGRLYLSHIGNVSFYSTTSLRDLGWHHVAVVREGGTISFFADGVLDNSQPCSATFNLTGPYAIGGLGEPYNGISYGFRGNIDEVATYNRALSATEISSIHAAGAAGRCPTGPGNLIVNGGFETPSYSAVGGVSPGSQFVRTRDVPGWEVAPGEGAVDIELQDFSGMVAHSGTQCLDLEGAEGLNTYFVRQDVAVTAGKTYRLRFAYAKNPARERSQLRLDISGANFANRTFEDTTVNSRNSPGWKTAEVEFTAALPSVQIQFTGTSPNPGYGMMLDSVTLVEIQKVQLAQATATYSQPPVQTFPPFPVGQTIDGIVIESHNGWAIYPRNGAPETAVWETVGDAGFAGGTELTFKIHSLGYLGRHGLGRFRLSVTSDPRTEFADGLPTDGDVSANWTVLDVVRAESSGGTTLTKLPDGSVLASGEHPYSEVYEVVANSPLAIITGIRLEALPDPSLPKGGPGRDFEGNFIVSEFEVAAAPAGSSGEARPCAPIPTGLVAWYRAEGDANNLTGANNGAFGAPKYAAGKVGRAFEFDGSNEVVVPDSAAFNLTAFAAEAWVYPTSLDGDVDIILNKEVIGFDTIAFEFGLKGPASVSANTIPVGNLALHLGGISGLPNDYSGWTDSGVKVPLNEWSHLVVSYENGVASMHLNGALGKRFTGLTGTLRTVAGPLKIGSRSDSVVQSVPGTRFNGRIDEVTLYNRALAEAEVTALFNAQEQGKCFRDLPVGDVSLTLTGASRAALGEDFVVTATVTNHGLAPAPGTVLTNVVPIGVSVVSVTSSQGSADNLAGFVIANLGTLPGGESATVRITCRALLNGNYTINSSLGRADTDPEPGNNQGTLAFEALPLALALGDDVTVRENSGLARIPVVLSAAVTRDIEAGYRLVEGTAKMDTDYRGTNGSVRLPAGATEVFIEVPVINDFFFESAETFTVELFTTNAVALGKTNGVVTLENDDPRPVLAVSDVVIREGNSGGTNAIFTVSLAGASEAVVTVDYATVSGTASGPTDYLNATGTLTFAAGERTKTVEVRVNGDTAVEANESFQLVLSNVANADLADANGAAAILNDDFVPGQLAGFRWDPIAGSPKTGENIPVRLTAVDGGGAAVPAFNGTVSLQATATGRAPASVVISEVDATASTLSRVEFGNVSTNSVDLSGWTVTFYDATTWPLPTGTVTLNSGNTLPPSGIFQVTEGAGINLFPRLQTGFPLAWSAAPQGRHVAVLLRDANGKIVDFFCAMRALPDQIQVPVSIPTEEWSGLPMVEASAPLTTYQRAGNADSNSARDWVTQSSTPNRFATIMTVPFADSQPLGVAPEFAADFQNGVWTGNVQLQSFAPQVALIADDGNGHRGQSAPFVMGTADDLAVTLTADPDQTQHPASSIHYRAEVTHCCETISSNVVVEIRLPAYFGSFRSQIAALTVSQGTNEIGTYFPTGATQSALLVRASLGELGVGQSAQIQFYISRQSGAQLQLMPTNITATATVSRTQPEQNLANNSANAVVEINAGCTILPEGALAWWRGELNLTDSLGHGALELVGSSSDFPAYGPGRTANTSALNLERSRGLQTAAGFQWHLGANQDFSAELWLRVVSDALRDRIMLLDKRDPATGVGFALFLDQGRLATVLTDSAGNTQSHFTRTPAVNAADLRDGRWHHVALSARRDPQVRTLLLAVDGGVTTLSTSLEVTGDLGHAPLRLGFEPVAGPTTAFVGLLDEVTVYSTALTTGQLTTLSRAGGAGKCLSVVTMDFVSPLPEQGTFPDRLSYQKPQKVVLKLTNEGPLGLPAAWVAAALDDGGSSRFLTPSLDTFVFSQWVTFHNFGPLAAGTNLLLEAEVTLTNVTSRSVTGFTAWQRQLLGQGYQLQSRTAFFSINPDGDADELPDAWELTNGYDPLTAADATADTDGDGFRNVDEYLLGTDPRSVADRLEIELITLTEGGVQVRFPGKTGKVYGLFRRENLGADWSEVARRSAADNSVIELSDPSPGAVSGFYRIQLITNP